jgi:uncharacterized membrane protein
MNPRPSPSGLRATSLDFDRFIGTLLRAGVAGSVALVAAGTLWHCLNTGAPEPDYSLAPANLFRFLVDNLEHWTSGTLRPRFLIDSGLCLLLLTPYLRVLASVVYFAAVEKNLKYACFTSFVFAALTYSLFLG